jgi:hypothetical protein
LRREDGMERVEACLYQWVGPRRRGKGTMTGVWEKRRGKDEAGDIDHVREG